MTKLAVNRLVSWVGTALALSMVAGCAMDTEDMNSGGEAQLDEPNPDEGGSDQVSPDQTGETEQALNTLVGEDFEEYSIGPLGSPWSLTPATSETVASIESTSDHGNVMLVEGSGDYGQFLIAKLPFSISSDVVASADIKPDSGASFVWALYGQGVGTYKRRIRLQRWPGSSSLIATAVPSGDTDCGSLRSGRWSKVSLVVHAQQNPHTFDVLINGKPTACTGLEVVTSAPFTSVQLMDASNESWGGDVRLDNVTLASP